MYENNHKSVILEPNYFNHWAPDFRTLYLLRKPSKDTVKVGNKFKHITECSTTCSLSTQTSHPLSLWAVRGYFCT